MKGKECILYEHVNFLVSVFDSPIIVIDEIKIMCNNKIIDKINGHNNKYWERVQQMF